MLFPQNILKLFVAPQKKFLALFFGHLHNFFPGNLGCYFMTRPAYWKVLASGRLPLGCAVSHSPLPNPRFCTQSTALFPWDPVCYPTPPRPLTILYPAQTIPPWSPSVSLFCQHHAETMARSFSAVFSLLQTTTGSCFRAAKADLSISLRY